jgi:hypothetical protein
MEKKSLNKFMQQLKDLETTVQKAIDLEEPKEKFITVTDGFRGGLKLKECWVRDSEYNKWIELYHLEILARVDGTQYPFKALHSNGATGYYKYVKFRPFSPENPPSVDWPVNIGKGKDLRLFHFSDYDSTGGLLCYYNRESSITTESGKEFSPDIFKFLNIEEVE